MPDIQPFDELSAEHLRLVIETGHVGIWELDLKTGKAIRNRAHDLIFGYTEPLAEWTYDGFLHHVVDGDRTRVDELQQAAIAGKREWKFECQIKTVTGERRWISAAGRPLLDAKGGITKLIGQVIDITDTKRNEARLQLITNELNHRVRNMLAMIKAMISLSASKASSTETFAKSLEGRVSALARSHQLLATGDFAAMSASSILRNELAAFSGLQERVVIWPTADPILKNAVGQGLTLIFHELLMNAMRHGALSNETGTVKVQIAGISNGTEIIWTERGGPTVGRQSGSGFGSTLITQAIASYGTVEMDFAQNGIECRIFIGKSGEDVSTT
ncbi:sensor histidine kinase [Croceicoccus gelatinilyticus]|uniref:sensor histidine kinase n=1 Tax=Croceicoccus gelatinilyticus TaxID=2835536 RepID=UPI001BCF32C8|nr:HWE histidine kinase domain-containing protein [Croceicoccus gelatinilyticus]MBS7668129.1 PAS domain S-box protein [Croceicoccus gelatinilyticus]